MEVLLFSNPLKSAIIIKSTCILIIRLSRHRKLFMPVAVAESFGFDYQLVAQTLSTPLGANGEQADPDDPVGFNGNQAMGLMNVTSDIDPLAIFSPQRGLQPFGIQPFKFAVLETSIHPESAVKTALESKGL